MSATEQIGECFIYPNGLVNNYLVKHKEKIVATGLTLEGARKWIMDEFDKYKQRKDEIVRRQRAAIQVELSTLIDNKYSETLKKLLAENPPLERYLYFMQMYGSSAELEAENKKLKHQLGEKILVSASRYLLDQYKTSFYPTTVYYLDGLQVLNGILKQNYD